MLAPLERSQREEEGDQIIPLLRRERLRNEKLATVDATGKVKAVKVGAVTITAKSGDKSAETKSTIKKK